MALIGGMLSSTFFVLTTTPTLYLLCERGARGRAAHAPSPSPPAASHLVPTEA